MLLVVEAVDDGDGRVRGELFHALPSECPVHDAVDVSAQDPGGVGDRLASANLRVVWAEEESMATELRHADLEGDAGARRCLLEDHREALSAQGFVGLARLGPVLDFSRQLEQANQVLADIEHRDEVSLGGHRRTILRTIQKRSCTGPRGSEV